MKTDTENRPVRRITLASFASALLVLSLTGPAYASADIRIVPTENGLVMVNTPTTITVSGFTGKAQLQRFDQQLGKWALIKSVSSNKPFGYSFVSTGIQRLRLVPQKGKALERKIRVYGRWSENATAPTRYGDVILASHVQYMYSVSYGAKASSDCRLVDVGAINGTPEIMRVSVASTGASESVIELPPNSSAGRTSIKVQGDVVVSTSGGKVGSWQELGVVWTCLSNPR